MRHLLRALALYFRSELTWRAARAATGPSGHFCVAKRDGFLYVEPRIGA